MSLSPIQQRILELKRQKNAVILAHNYQIPEIQDIADHVADSLELAQKAQTTDADIIVFCGVHFMAESAKLLNPQKKVLLPSLQAGCFMANMITPEALVAKKREHPDATVVTYINSSAAVKAESDIIVTSANAVQICRQLPSQKILFTPDEHLGGFVAEQIPEKEFIFWKGFCYVHTRLLAEKVSAARLTHPEAIVVAHPECPREIRQLADHVCGTGAMIRYCRASPATTFLIATEPGMTYRLQKELPDKKFWNLCIECLNMKQITLEKLLAALEEEQYEITVPPAVAAKATQALDKMLKMS